MARHSPLLDLHVLKPHHATAAPLVLYRFRPTTATELCPRYCDRRCGAAEQQCESTAPVSIGVEGSQHASGSAGRDEINAVL